MHPLRLHELREPVSVDLLKLPEEPHEVQEITAETRSGTKEDNQQPRQIAGTASEEAIQEVVGDAGVIHEEHGMSVPHGFASVHHINPRIEHVRNLPVSRKHHSHLLSDSEHTSFSSEQTDDRISSVEEPGKRCTGNSTRLGKWYSRKTRQSSGGYFR